MRHTQCDANGSLTPFSLSLCLFFYCPRCTFELDEMDNERIPLDKIIFELGETIAKRGPDQDMWEHRAALPSQCSLHSLLFI